jgi:hypothetical protein
LPSSRRSWPSRSSRTRPPDVAGRVWRKRPQILRRLQVHEASLVDRPANPGAAVELFKRRQSEGKPMTVETIQARLEAGEAITKGDVDELLDELARELAKPGESVGAALLRNWRNPELQAYYALHASADPDPAPARPMAKAAAGDSAWGMIEKAAKELSAREPLTFGEAVDEVCRREPWLYKRYVREQRDAE